MKTGSEPDLDAIFAERRVPNEAAVESAGSLLLGTALEACTVIALVASGLSRRFTDGGFGPTDGFALLFLILVLWNTVSFLRLLRSLRKTKIILLGWTFLSLILLIGYVIPLRWALYFAWAWKARGACAS